MLDTMRRRLDALEYLETLKPSKPEMSGEVVAALLAVLGDPAASDSVREALMAEALGQLGPEMSCEVVKEILGTVRDPEEREAAKWFLERVGLMRGEVVAALQEIPDDPAATEEAREVAAEVLEWVRGQNKRETGMLDTRERRREALKPLQPEMSGEELAALLEVLGDLETVAALRVVAAEALGQLGPEMSCEVVTALLAVLGDPAASDGDLLIVAAAEALGELGGQMSGEAVALLSEVLHDPAAGFHAREAAAWELGRLGPEMSGEVSTTLLEVLCDPATDAVLRSVAARSLGQLAPRLDARERRQLMAHVYANWVTADEGSAGKLAETLEDILTSLLVLDPDAPESGNE